MKLKSDKKSYPLNGPIYRLNQKVKWLLSLGSNTLKTAKVW
jgi:hypothetical protein